MTKAKMLTVFNTQEDLYLEDKDLPAKYRKTSRSDLNAFLLLDQLLPGESYIIGAAEHDEIWLDADLDELAKAATEEDIKALIRCGVRLDSDTESLAMFV